MTGKSHTLLTIVAGILIATVMLANQTLCQTNISGSARKLTTPIDSNCPFHIYPVSDR